MTDRDPVLPEPPSVTQLSALGIRDSETYRVTTGEQWWRVHRTDGRHVLAWNAFRRYGPLLRFDPHPEPTGENPSAAVWYGASTPDAALAEAFQATRTIDRGRDRPYLTALAFVRPLVLLDVTADAGGAWPTRASGNFALSTAAHAITQRWARAINDAFPDLDGVRYSSRFAGAPCIVLSRPAADAMPVRPELSLPLNHPEFALRVAGAANRLGYTVI